MPKQDQKSEFLGGEGDAWFLRNMKEFDAARDPLVAGLSGLGMTPRRVLEIGCANGARLSAIRNVLGADAGAWSRHPMLFKPRKRAIPS